jgi:hypothetical protein
MIGRFALATVVAVLTVLAITGRIDPGPVRIILFGHTALSLAALTLNVVGKSRLQGMVDRVRSAVPVVTSGLIEAPRTDVAELIAEVRALGFDMSAATDTTLSGPPIRTWILLEPAGETWVEIGIGLRPMAIFLSEATTGRLIETAYPLGETIENPELSARAVSTSAADAFAAHRDALRDAGGEGRLVKTVDDYLAAERVQRAATGGMRIQSHIETNVNPAIRDWAISLAVDVLSLVALAVVGPTAPG